MDIALLSDGDYNETATVKVADGSTVEFKAVPSDLQIYLTATAYKLEKKGPRSQLRTDLLAGESDTITVKAGENNTVSLVLKKLPAENTGTSSDNSQSNIPSNNSSGSHSENTDGGNGGTAGGGSSGSSENSSGAETVSTITFTVHYYKQNLSDDDYTEVSSDLQTLECDSGSIAETGAKNYTGFTLNNVTMNTNAQDGTTEANFYYDRDTYRVYYEAGTGAQNIPAALSYRYGARVTVSTEIPTKSGYIFSGWKNGATVYGNGGETSFVMGTEDATLNAIWVSEGSSTTLDLSVAANSSEITVSRQIDYVNHLIIYIPDNTINYKTTTWLVDGNNVTSTSSSNSYYIDNNTFSLYLNNDMLESGIYDIAFLAEDNSGNYYSFITQDSKITFPQLTQQDIDFTYETDSNNSNLVVFKMDPTERNYLTIMWAVDDSSNYKTSKDTTQDFYISSDGKWLYMDTTQATDSYYTIYFTAVDDEANLYTCSKRWNRN